MKGNPFQITALDYDTHRCRPTLNTADARTKMAHLKYSHLQKDCIFQSGFCIQVITYTLHTIPFWSTVIMIADNEYFLCLLYLQIQKAVMKDTAGKYCHTG